MPTTRLQASMEEEKNNELHGKVTSLDITLKNMSDWSKKVDASLAKIHDTLALLSEDRKGKEETRWNQEELKQTVNPNDNGGTSRTFNRIGYNLQVKLPNYSFNGTVEPHEWMDKISMALDQSGVNEDYTKIRTAIQFMEGAAHAWAMRWLDRNDNKPNIFPTFKEEFFKRADRCWNEPYKVQLAHLYQRDATVEEYTEKFQTLEAKVRDMDDKDVMEFYIANMRPEIKTEVRMQRPQNLEDAIFYARQAEEKIIALRRKFFPAQRRPLPPIIERQNNQNLNTQ